jgi:hypothetical protein
VGRHSSPDDDDDDEGDLVDALLADPAAADTESEVGRHGEPAALEPPAFEPAALEPAALEPPVPEPHFEAGTGVPAAASEPAAPRLHSTAADLALVRHHGDVRARCIAGVIVPFIGYAAVLLAVGGSGTAWAIWVFAPLILAGILVGAFLDAGHKRYPTG